MTTAQSITSNVNIAHGKNMYKVARAKTYQVCVKIVLLPAALPTERMPNKDNVAIKVSPAATRNMIRSFCGPPCNLFPKRLASWAENVITPEILQTLNSTRSDVVLTSAVKS